MNEIVNNIMKEIEYAKNSHPYGTRENLYQAYGMAIMAFKLNAITFEEFMELNHAAIYDGINNPKYF